jgi:hypothetical protein
MTEGILQIGRDGVSQKQLYLSMVALFRATQKGNLASQIPLRIHRWDESDRVFLAGCSPAEPGSASRSHSAWQSCYMFAVERRIVAAEEFSRTAAI